MKVSIPSAWLFPTSLEEAKHVQKLLADRLILEDRFDTVHQIGGMDVSNNLKDPEEMIHAAAVVLNANQLIVEEKSTVSFKQLFPYIPGFLGFREAPALVQAFEGLKQPPQLIMVDGHGLSHPRRLGIASHVGVLIDIPTIGVAKSILVGKPSGELGSESGDQVSLMWKGVEIARVVRTKPRCNPLFISTGHRVSLDTAVQFVLQYLKGYRLPEPTRQAHLAANSCRIDYAK